jgi:cytidyltransferase-like protein
MITSINFLKPLEKVFLYHLKNLSKMILSKGIVQTPIIADKKHGIVLDGSHRYIFFLMNGFKEVPVKFVDYHDEHIRVGSRLIHRYLIEEKMNISKEEVIKRGLSGNLFPPRTTRHFFPFRKNERINLPLDSLKKGKNVDVGNFIADTTLQNEIDHNQKYLSEIENEFDELIRYMEEIRQTKNYLKNQILMMQEKPKSVAFFPGKFQPVHMGHITSIMKIFEDYEKIIIGITSDSPNVLSLQKRKEVFQSVLSRFDKFEYVFFDTALIDIKDKTILPKFDVCVSGNQKVLDFMKKNNFKTRLLKRSSGVGYSGTEIRSIIDSKKL